jgi:hypothetical protein
MQATTKGQIGALAFNVALEKAQSGAPPMSKAEFDGLCETVAVELEWAVEVVLSGKTATTAKPKRASRKASAPKVPSPSTGNGKRPGIDPEALKAYVGSSKEGAASLQQIADNFGVSKGVAQRAVEALPGVKSALGTKIEGKRGVPPTAYWVE